MGKCIGLSVVVIASIAVIGCKSLPQGVIKGAQVVSAICEWIEEESASGAVVAICATAEEITKFGKHAELISLARQHEHTHY